MKIKDIINNKEDTDVVVILNRTDIQRINMMSDCDPDFLILDIKVGEELYNDKIALLVTGGSVPKKLINKLNKDEIEKLVMNV